MITTGRDSKIPHIIAEEDCSMLSRQNKDVKDGITYKLMAEL